MLSIILAARNDDFGGNFLGRMQVSLSVLDELCGRCQQEPEVIVVEWNPPTDRQWLSEILAQPKSISLRIVTVPPEIHKTISGSDKMPMFEYIAKNVGIRRAKGAMILCTNPDIVFSDQMVSRLIAGGWDQDHFYRAKRSDLGNGDLPTDLSVDRILALCRQKVTQTHGPLEAAGDFMLMSRSNWFDLCGYPELLSNGSIDTLMVALATKDGMMQIDLGEPIFHQYHNSQNETRDRPQMQWSNDLIVRNSGVWGLGDTELQTWDARDNITEAVASNIAPAPPPPRPLPISKPHCPQCSSTIIGIGGGMRVCNTCGFQWTA